MGGGNHNSISENSRGTDRAKGVVDTNCLEFVRRVVKNLRALVQQGQLPYTIRAILRVVLIISTFKDRQTMETSYKRYRNLPFNIAKEKLPLLARLLAGCWLSIGFRDASIFGLPPPMADDTELYLAYFQSCRILFENLLSGQPIPDATKTSVYSIELLNRYIRDN